MDKKNSQTNDFLAILLFGSTGDLTKRKLVPALYRLFEKGVLGEEWAIIGIGRRGLTSAEFIEHLEIDTFIANRDEKLLETFLTHLHYVQVDLGSPDHEAISSAFSRIEHRDEQPLRRINRLFYLATPAQLFDQVSDFIKGCDLLAGDGWKRVVFEKPFGHDEASARTLHRNITSIFTEEQIYRIDHYLGKELVQNILVFRFANPLLHQIWNNLYVDSVQITVAESLGVGGRGEYYDTSGALRDMVQNHMLQVLALVAMEEPESLAADHIRAEKTKVLEALDPVEENDLVLGQYKQGKRGGKLLPAYREEEGVEENSRTETYAALRLGISNGRWEGVPFYVRTGKRLARSFSEVNVLLKQKDCNLFEKSVERGRPNVITIRIKPDEGIKVHINVKQPGKDIVIHPTSLSFCHSCEFGGNTPEAYEVLLNQVLLGDHTLFISWDEIRESWKFIDAVIERSDTRREALPNYTAGSFGPEAADRLLAEDGRAWIATDLLANDRGNPGCNC